MDVARTHNCLRNRVGRSVANTWRRTFAKRKLAQALGPTAVARARLEQSDVRVNAADVFGSRPNLSNRHWNIG